VIIGLIVLMTATLFACCDVPTAEYPREVMSGAFVEYQYEHGDNRHWFHYLDDEGFQRRKGITNNKSYTIKLDGRFPIAGDRFELLKTDQYEYELRNSTRDAIYENCDSDYDTELLQVIIQGYFVDLMYYSGLTDRYYIYVNDRNFLTYQPIEGTTSYTIKTDGNFPVFGDYFIITKTGEKEHSIRVLCSATTVEPKCKVCEECEEYEECTPCDSPNEQEDHGPPDRHTQ